MEAGTRGQVRVCKLPAGAVVMATLKVSANGLLKEEPDEPQSGAEALAECSATRTLGLSDACQSAHQRVTHLGQLCICCFVHLTSRGKEASERSAAHRSR